MSETDKIDMEKMGTPIAIVIAGALIAAAMYFGGGSAGGTGEYSFNQGAQKGGEQVAAKPVPKVTATDHIIGSPNAELIIVEYTDLECPFCKQFHNTQNQG
jgi:protein-disulfide isomerase